MNILFSLMPITCKNTPAMIDYRCVTTHIEWACKNHITDGGSQNRRSRRATKICTGMKMIERAAVIGAFTPKRRYNRRRRWQSHWAVPVACRGEIAHDPCDLGLLIILY